MPGMTQLARSSSDARSRLATALDTMAAVGTVVLPRSARLFERHVAPWLPVWVERPGVPRLTRQVPEPRVWRPELAAAAVLAVSPAEHNALGQVDTFLRKGGATRPIVPHRERSLEVFGHEKRLDALLRTRLFTSGALNVELLRCYIAPLPLTAQHTGDPGLRPRLLIVENHATYASVLTLARERASAGAPALAIGYGAGNQLPASIAGAWQLDPPPVDIAYFGDLDAAGLTIARATVTAAQAAGLPAVRPARPLYAELLAHGRPDTSGSDGPLSPEAAGRLAAWLGDPALVRDAAAMLTAGTRLAQEAVGYERLTALPTWC